MAHDNTAPHPRHTANADLRVPCSHSTTRSRVRGTLAGKSAGAAGSSFDILSSDDEVFTAPAPKQRRVLDEAALQAKANALIDDCLAGDGSDAAGARMSARRAADRDYDRQARGGGSIVFCCLAQVVVTARFTPWKEFFVLMGQRRFFCNSVVYYSTCRPFVVVLLFCNLSGR